MRSPPLIATAIYAAALALLLPGLTASWTTAHSNFAAINAGLFNACVEQHAPWLPAALLRRGPHCFDLSRAATPRLGFSPNLHGLLQAARVMAGLAAAFAAVGAAASAVCLALGAYPKRLAVIPLVAGPAALLCEVLAVSFYGGVHANSYAAARSDFPHARLGGGWTSSLVGGIIAFLGMVPCIVDVALPDKTRYGGGGGGVAWPHLHQHAAARNAAAAGASAVANKLAPGSASASLTGGPPGGPPAEGVASGGERGSKRHSSGGDNNAKHTGKKPTAVAEAPPSTVASGTVDTAKAARSDSTGAEPTTVQ
jgi:hypothetical protein